MVWVGFVVEVVGCCVGYEGVIVDIVGEVLDVGEFVILCIVIGCVGVIGEV